MAKHKASQPNNVLAWHILSGASMELAIRMSSMISKGRSSYHSLFKIQMIHKINKAPIAEVEKITIYLYIYLSIDIYKLKKFRWENKLGWHVLEGSRKKRRERGDGRKTGWEEKGKWNTWRKMKETVQLNFIFGKLTLDFLLIYLVWKMKLLHVFQKKILKFSFLPKLCNSFYVIFLSLSFFLATARDAVSFLAWYPVLVMSQQFMLWCP